jgi:hypothetical protein
VEISLSSDRDSIGYGILGDDEESWTTSYLDPLALPDRIAIGSFVCSDYFPNLIEDISWFFWEPLFEEFFHRNFSNKTESLTIFAIRIWQSSFFCYLSDL